MTFRGLKESFAELLQSSPALARLSVLAVTAGLVVLINCVRPALSSLEERIGALGWTLTADAEPEQRITLVVIDEASLAEVGPWPWSRSDMASLVRAIDDAGAQLQMHDISYPESRPGDAEFIAALGAASGAVIAQVPALQPAPRRPSRGPMTHPLAGVSCGRRLRLGRPELFGLPAGYVASAAGFSRHSQRP